MLKKIKKYWFKNSRSGQNMVEYSLVLVGTVVVLIVVLGSTGIFTKKIDETINEAVIGTKCMALEVCYDPAGCPAECGNDCCEKPAENPVTCNADCECATDADCNNMQFCDGVESCSSGQCQAGIPPSINDGIACTDDSCDEVADVIVHIPNDSLCDDGLACNGVETCDAFSGCQAGTSIDVDDGIACTIDTCTDPAGTVVNTPNNAACGDGQYCNGVEVCTVGVGCQAGVPVNVDDGVACTDDSCDEVADVVIHAPNNSLCDNGQFCDGSETCNLFGCLPGIPPILSDSIACTDDSCDEVADVVVHAVNDGNCNADTVCADYSCHATWDCQVVYLTPECRPSAGICDIAENCTGAADTCPADTFMSSTTVCRVENGVCDVAERCTGFSAGCPADGVDPATTVCRAKSGVCDVAEMCTGSGTSCPTNVFEPATEECRASVDACDVAEMCTGSNNACPLDEKSIMGTSCSGGYCDGTGGCDECTFDSHCDDSQACNGAETCDASGVCQAGTPIDVDDGVACTDDTCIDPAGTVVNTPNDGNCSIDTICADYYCNAAAGCLVNYSTAVCRASAGVCDIADYCTGSSAACPADAKSTAVCRASAGTCDIAESCDGFSNACPGDLKSTAVCRASAGTCDIAESCDGSSNTCPWDEKSIAECRPSAGICDIAESCDGFSNACPGDLKSTAVCRASAGTCDPVESCSGSSNSCPVDINPATCCGDGACNGTEDCNSCTTDCGFPDPTYGTCP